MLYIIHELLGCSWVGFAFLRNSNLSSFPFQPTLHKLFLMQKIHILVSTRVATLLICLFSGGLHAQMPQVAYGQLIRWADFPSQYVQRRHVDIWLPPGFDSTRRYPVLYMHDGQMLFDSTTTWNKQEWGVDEVLGGLVLAGGIRPVIVVAVWNAVEGRYADYLPEKPWKMIPEAERNALLAEPNARMMLEGKPVSDAYLQFLVKELKPAIDNRFPTLQGRKNTYIAGSSMGGLISWYALCEHPNVFGGAICMSTHWTGIYRAHNNPIPAAFFSYLDQNLPKAGKHKMYFDFGSATLDSLYPPFQAQADVILKSKGYRIKDWQTKSFPGEPHTENAWRKRLHEPMLFMLKK
jgi:predicted alpha/beta superfamily hydrolase